MVPEPGEVRPDHTREFKVLSPGTMISHYRIIEKIGEGGMGVVYKAADTKLDRTVALKFLPTRLLCDAEARERFEHEAKAASALNHPNIATIHEIDEAEGRCFIAMEFIDGGSIKDLLKKTLSMKEILDLATQIAEGLAAAHESGVVHRDMKPDNIMLTKRGLAKIMDFGLAKLRGATRLTRDGTTLGTLQYMSPEQTQGREIDRRSDIFSLGVILYEMITGRLPFGGDNEAAIINSILNDTPEPLVRYKANVPDGLQRVVDKALAKDRSERYQHADEMVADLKHERRLLETGVTRTSETRVIGPRSRTRLLPVVIPAAVALVVILLVFVLEPFRVEMGPGREAIAQENSLAIMYFENLADRDDPERLGEILTTLLITDLSESEYISVVSSQRLYDILKLLGKEGAKVVDRDVATEVATKAEAKWMLLGNILKTVPEVVIATQLVNVKTGKVEASQRIIGERDEDVFSLVDRLSVEIKEDLSLPAAARQEPDRPVADVTTHSPEAYRHYIEALDYGSKYYFPEAQTSYERALEYDSTFVMAYYGLADAKWVQGLSGVNESIAKAVKYSDKVSEKERQYITAVASEISGDFNQAVQELQKIAERYPDDKEAPWRLGMIHQVDLMGPQAAIAYFERVIEIDPLHKLAYNQLAYCYNDIGDFDRSIWAINKYISLAPQEANPYDSRGDLYAVNGKFDLAMESYSRALEIKPDFTWSRQKLGHLCLVRRDYAEAEANYRKLASSTDNVTRSVGRTSLAFIPMYQGKLEEALRVLDTGLAADRMERAEESWESALKHASKTEVYRAKKDFDSALREWVEYMRIASFVRVSWDNGQSYYVLLLLESGQTVRANEVARALKQDVEEKGEGQRPLYAYALGCIRLAEGNTDEGLSHLEMAAESAERTRVSFWPLYTLAKAYLEAGRLAEAVDGFESVLSQIDGGTPVNGVRLVRAHYLLGIAYEESGWSNKAIEQYEEFLETWKDADPGLPEVEDATRRLAELRQAS